MHHDCPSPQPCWHVTHSPSLGEDYASSGHLGDLSLGHMTSGANPYKEKHFLARVLKRVLVIYTGNEKWAPVIGYLQAKA